jgi:dipeptidyl aminopeptidase/acylaminoacyl peptidase
MIRSWSVFAGLLALTCAQARSPITHQDVYLMKQVGAPQASPDGKWVVFPLSEPAYDDAKQASDLWIVPADGSAQPRRLTNTRGPESGVVWSPDSKRIAFSAKREGDDAAQIYVLDIAAGGEAVRVAQLSTGASSPRFRPDGKAIAFISSVFPGAADDAANQKAAADQKARKYRARVYESFPIRYWDHWMDEKQVHLFVQDLAPDARPRDLLAGTRLAASPGFGGAQSTSAEELQHVWAPDGQSLVFVATTNRNGSAYESVIRRLYQVPAAGGEPKAVTTGKFSYSKPAFRPDGKALYALFEPEDDKVYHIARMAVFAWPTPGERALVAASSDRSVGAYGFSSDSRTVYFLAEDSGQERLYAVPAAGGDVKQVSKAGAGCYTNLSAARNAPVLIANWESAISPGELVRFDLASGTHRLLSQINREPAAAIDWEPLQHFWHTSKTGKKIHSMIALPPAFDKSKKYPLLVLMHGGPASMWRDQFFTRWNYHLLASPGYVVLLTNYTGSTGFGEKFGQEIQLDPLKTPGEEINGAADEAIRRFPFIDGGRQAAAGASYGGHLANWMQATTTRYKCLVSHAGLINLESQWGTSDTIYHREVNNGGPPWDRGKVWQEQNPIRLAKDFRTPILLTVGERDYRVPLNQTLENWSVLQRLRVPSRLIVFEDANHWISKGEDSRFWYQEVQAWLKKWL